MRQAALVEAFSEQLERLHLDDQVFALIERALRESHTDRSRERLETMTRLRADADRLQQRLDKLYVDHLDGRISGEMHDRMASTWREERERCLRHLEGLHSSEDVLVDDGIALLELGRNAHKTFNKQSPGTQNAVLKLLISNTVWARGQLRVEFNEPFGMLDKMADLGKGQNRTNEPQKSRRTSWLPE